MIFPRMSALSEALWTEPAKKNLPGFEKRLQNQISRYHLWGANFSNAYYGIDVAISAAPANKGLQVKLQSKDKGGKITYAIAGKHYAKNYTAPVLINQDAQLTALYTKEGKLLDSVTLDLKVNKATGKKITLANPPLAGYEGEGAFTLVNGISNRQGLARTKEFIGYRRNNMQAIVDLGSTQKISKVVVSAIITGGSRVYAPELVEVYGSLDGQAYKFLGKTADYTPIDGKGNFSIEFPGTSTRYVQIIVKPIMKIAEGKPGAGEAALMFIDEIEVW
jgi:hexosaminidase